jgi:hypothetical protein
VSQWWSRGTAGRRATSVVVAVVTVVVLAVVGTLLPVQRGAFEPSPLPLAGRTSSTCATSPEEGATATLSAVAVRAAPDREGRLTGTAVAADQPTITVTEQGRADQVPAPSRPVILEGEGVMATAASAMVFSQARSGSVTGLMAAPCTPPATEHWFVGVGASRDHRTSLILTNPDDGQAEVDLRFYGRNGIVVVPGSPGVIIEGGESRTVALDALVQIEGPLTVAVRASQGRVSAVALDRRSQGVEPRGADWTPGSVPPSTSLVLPGVPEGAGARELLVANPGTERAEVAIEVLGIEGPFAPIGAENLVVPPESTATVGLAPGLAEQSGSIRVSSTLPVAATVQSISSVQGARPDLAVEPAVAPLSRTGIVALATVDGVDSELTLSNGGEAEAQVSFEVLSYEGVRLRSDQVVVIGGGTVTRRLTSPAPAYLVVRTPAGSAVYGSVTYSWSTGGVAGLASVPVTSPDLAGLAPQATLDPSLGQ